MARENQGLQIALIVSVMLVIILGASTYYYFRQYDEASVKAASSDANAMKKAQAATEAGNDLVQLKKLIGVPETDKVDVIVNTTFKDDISKYGGSYPEADRVYRRLLEKMQGTINDKNGELAAAKTEVQRLADQIKIFEASKQQQIDDFAKAREAANQDLASERAKYNAEADASTRVKPSSRRTCKP